MKIGYPCINRELDCTTNSTFRLKSYSEEKLINTIKSNLECLISILEYNYSNKILFFRISSDIIPFASHEINNFDWKTYFKSEFIKISNFIKAKKMRISSHPDQFVLINSIDDKIVNNSIRELEYHAELFNSLELEDDEKIQIHVGGVYNDKEKSIRRFIDNYKKLDSNIKKYLVIENDERLYDFSDCLKIYYECGVPIVFDYFHYKIKNKGENIEYIFDKLESIWSVKDGLPIVDYSSQMPNEKIGKHCETIDINDFMNFIDLTKKYDFDIMLEIKDKQNSAKIALDLLKDDKRLIN